MKQIQLVAVTKKLFLLILLLYFFWGEGLAQTGMISGSVRISECARHFAHTGVDGRAGDGASYFALRGFDAQPILYNSLPGQTSGNLAPSNLEEIQVIKGPPGWKTAPAISPTVRSCVCVQRAQYHTQAEPVNSFVRHTLF